MKNKRFIILENKNQVLEYLEKIGFFQGVIPIAFNLETQKLLLEYKIKFINGEKCGESYVYKKDKKLLVKEIGEIYKKINIEYRGINLFQLFYADLIVFLITLRRYLRILKEIKKSKGIDGLVIFKDINSNPNEELYSRIAEEVFKENSKVIKYRSREKTDNHKRLIKITGKIQNLISKIKISLLKKTDNKIFFCGNKKVFGQIINKLSKKENKIFRCNDSLQKSFFINKKYIPFYKFSKIKTKHQKKLLRDIGEFIQNPKNFRFLDKLNLEEEEENILKEWVRYYLKFKFFEISGIINNMIKLMGKRKIDLIMLGEDINVFEKTFAQIGKKFNIPSIVIQHGVIGKKRGFLPKSAEYILVFGENSKKLLINWGYPKKNIIITGSPQFDKYNKKIKKKKQKEIVFIMGSLASNELAPEVEVSKERWQEVYRILLSVLKKFPEYKLIVKLRSPSYLSNMSFILPKEKFENLKFVADVDPIKLLSRAEIVIVTDSTMALDALLLEKPVISIDFKETDNIYPNKIVNTYRKYNSIKNVYNEKQLENAIKKSKKQTNREIVEIKKYLEKELYKLDGMASQRVAEFIKKLLDSEDK